MERIACELLATATSSSCSESDMGRTDQQQHQLGTKNNPKNKKLFPQKLWDLINDQKYNFCLRWSDDGQLVFLNRDDFEDSYLKTPENQFHTQKAISFVRQMNMYGFKKVDDCYYENDNFKRGCEHLLKNMIRKHTNRITNQTPLISATSSDTANKYCNITNNPSSLLQSAAALSLTAPTLAADNSNLVDHCKQHPYQAYSTHRPQLIINNEFESKSLTKAQKSNFLYRKQRQQQLANVDVESFNEDSLSLSSADYCCSAGSNSGRSENLATIFDGIDSRNTRHHKIDKEHLGEISSIKKQVQHFNLSPHFNSTIFNSFQPTTTRNSSPTAVETVVNTNGQNAMSSDLNTSNQFNNHLSNFNNFEMNLRTQTNESNCAEFSAHGLSNHQFLFNDQKELIAALAAQQQSDIQFPRDLTTTSANLVDIQPENSSNLDAFYALLLTINSNLYDQTAMRNGNTNKGIAFDINRFLSLQQVYQQTLAQQDLPKLANQNNNELSTSLSRPSQVVNGLTLQAPTPERDASPVSLLVHNQPPTSSVKGGRSLEMFETECRSGSDRSNGKLSLTTKRIQDPEPVTKRRESKTNRSFKRSVDSILDSNNNSSPERHPDILKRIKIEINSDKPNNDEHLESTMISSHAKNLVTQVALSREARVDMNVICEASKYAERFVETLFDTAQVIARHSNGSSLSDPIMLSDSHTSLSEEKEVKNDKEIERCCINLSDLTSAVKLLPSKLSKILE